MDGQTEIEIKEDIERLTTEDYWNSLHSEFKPFKVKNIEISKELKKFLPVNPDYKCVEIGAYFGRYLCYMADKFKYKPCAIEYSQDCNHIAQMFEANDIKDYQILNEDFFKIKDVEFDVVTSFGFIEHFDNYEEVIGKHFDILKPGGYLVLGVPAWGCLQELFSRAFCSKERIDRLLDTHNTKMMKLNILKKSISNLHCKILFSGYVRGTDFWFNWNDTFVKKELRWLVYILKQFNRFIGKNIPPSKFYSPSILVIVQKEAK